MIRLITFDALHTLLTPRLPIYVQYAQTFAPHLGALQPAAIRGAFKTGPCPPRRSWSRVPTFLCGCLGSSVEGCAEGAAGVCEGRGGVVEGGGEEDGRWGGGGCVGYAGLPEALA